MQWNITDITFIHPPDIFTGTFDNAKMQARHEQQIQIKLEEIKAAIASEPDPLKAMKRLHTKDQLKFFQNNERPFRDTGRFEEAVVALFGRLNAPFSSGGDAAVWNTLFAACETTRLYNLGHPVTFSSATVYRGSVSECTRGLSWTPDRQRAEWFAERWKNPSLGGGVLYEVDITKDEVLVSLKHRHEEEFILSPEFIRSAAIRVFKTAG